MQLDEVLVFLMLASYIRAYIKGAFENIRNKCPHSRETLEIYFQILLPVYLFNLHVQRTDSNITEIVQLLTSLLHQWQIKNNGNYKWLKSILYLVNKSNRKNIFRA